MAGILLLVATLAQAAAAPAPDDSAQLERIRKGLDHQPAITTEPGTDGTGRPIFRMNIRAWGPEKPLWDNWTNVPSYIRPYWNGYHNDFLAMVTPEEFRAGTMYPVGIPIGALIEALSKHIRAAHHISQEEKARDEVRQALAELLACRADRSRPGC